MLKIKKVNKIQIMSYTLIPLCNILKTNTLSSMYKTFTNQLTNFGIRGVIWQQGKADFALNDKLDSFRLISDFAYLTSNVFLEYMNLFGDLDIYSIQYGKIDIELSNELRSAQLQSTYLVNNVEIIPTYDCHILDYPTFFYNLNLVTLLDNFQKTHLLIICCLFLKHL